MLPCVTQSGGRGCQNYEGKGASVGRFSEALQVYHSYFTLLCIGSEAGSYVSLIDACITQLEAQGTSIACEEGTEEEDGADRSWATLQHLRSPHGPEPGLRYKYSKLLQLFPSGSSTEKHFWHRKVPEFQTRTWFLERCPGREEAKLAEVVRPGTNPGTGTAYHPTALPTVGPYALPVPGFVPCEMTVRRSGVASDPTHLVGQAFFGSNATLISHPINLEALRGSFMLLFSLSHFTVEHEGFVGVGFRGVTWPNLRHIRP